LDISSLCSLRAFLILALGLTSGCATTSGLFNSYSFERDFPKASDKNPVTNIMALWQPTTGTGLDGLTCRGFAGQIFFFSHQKQLPAEVNGTIRIYVFDDQGSDEDQVKPFHQFDFSPEAWKLQFCRTKLGPTYTIFVPYTRKGPHTAQCSLRIRYTPANGAPISSDMVNVALPGSGGSKETENIAKRKAARNGDATDHELSSNARGHDAASRSRRDPALQLASATVEPKPAHSPAKLTAAERQRIITETLARQDESADAVDDDVVYVATERTATSRQKPFPSDRAPSHRVPHVFDEEDEPEAETDTKDLPR
jgi:hypothetical protein